MEYQKPFTTDNICPSNDLVKSEALAPILSLYCDQMKRSLPRKGQYKIALNYDEFASIRVSSVFHSVSTGRRHDIVNILVVQDANQLRTLYTKEEAEALINMTGISSAARSVATLPKA